MLLKRYEEQGSLFNSSVLAMTSKADLQAYRGGLVIIDGEVTDAAGRRKPPVMLLRDAVLLADETALKMVVGGLDSVSEIPQLLERYSADFADDALVFLLAPNAHTEARIEEKGFTGYILPWDAMVWKQITETLRLEKSDFKGLSAADKVLVTYEKLVGYTPNFPLITLDEMLANATSAKRETHGAI